VEKEEKDIIRNGAAASSAESELLSGKKFIACVSIIIIIIIIIIIVIVIVIIIITITITIIIIIIINGWCF